MEKPDKLANRPLYPYYRKLGRSKQPKEPKETRTLNEILGRPISPRPASTNNVPKLTRKELCKQEIGRVKNHLKRAQNANLPATLTLEEWISTLDHFHWKCAYCQTGEYALIEHFIPLSHGKGTTQDNCVPACTRCNVTKQAWHPLSKNRPRLKGVEEGFERVHHYLTGLSEKK
jgi:5-methylcytosine-specific restriction endonuclease McrA